MPSNWLPWLAASADAARCRRSPWPPGALAAAAGLACVLAIAPLRVVFAAATVPDNPAASPDEGDEADPLDVALLAAAEQGDVEKMQRLIDRGAKAGAVIHGDGSPLIAAARSGQAEVLRFLLAKGADVNARVWADSGPNRGRGEWRTALLMARRNGHEDVARILLAGGARE